MTSARPSPEPGQSGGAGSGRRAGAFVTTATREPRGQARGAAPVGRLGTVVFLIALGLYGAVLYGAAGRPLETDEFKYIVLARNLSWDPASYTLRGTLLLPRIAQDVNDVPLFYHPPLVPVLLRTWYELALRQEGEGARLALPRGGEPTAEVRDPGLASGRLLAAADPGYAVVPIAAQLGSLALLWLVWGGGRGRAERVWPVTLLALSPAALFASQVWLDGVLSFLMFLTLTLYRRAVRRGRWWDFSLAGACLGLALLTKFSALLLVPVLGVYHLTAVGRDRRASRLALAALLPTLVLAAPWYGLFFATYGELLPSWIAPSDEMQRKFPFVAMMVQRSPLYYVSALVAFLPACLFALASFWRRLRDADTALLAGFVLLLLAVFTAVGVSGGGYQTRHVLPALPPLCLLAGRGIARLPRSSWCLAGLLMCWSAWNLQANLTRERFERSAEVELFLPWREQGAPIR